MSTAEHLPIPWTPVSLPPRTTEPRRRHRPARGERPTAPHPLQTLPPRVLPVEQPTAAPPAPAAPASPAVDPAPDAAAAAVPRSSAVLTPAVAARHRVPLHEPQTLADLFALAPGDLDAMVAAGALLEVRLGGDRLRYAFVEDLPAHHPADGAR